MGRGKRCSQFGHVQGTQDLSELLGVPLGELARLAQNVPLSVVRSSSAKRGGARRPILKAGPQLKGIHDLIKRRILRQLTFGDCVHGYCRGRSYVTAALPHAGHPMLLAMDIRRFFPSVRPEQVRRAWTRLGFGEKAATMLTRLTTAEYQLPQGFRTSNHIANMVREPLDRRIEKIADEEGLTYTNFCDNLFLSGAAIVPDVEHRCREAARRSGWRLHDVILGGRGEPKSVLNMEVREALYVREAYLEETRGLVRSLGSGTKLDTRLLKSVRGRIAHIRQVNREQAEPLGRMLQKVVRG